MTSTVILGGGLAGLSAAYHLGGRAALYEQRTSLGGLCGQVRVDGFRFDAVPHVMHFRDDSVRLSIDRLLKGELLSFERQARIFTHNKFIRYPFQAHLYGLPANVVEECVRASSRAYPKTAESCDSLKEWILANFGSGIAKHFMFPYNEKFWGLPPEELTSEWVNGIVPVPTEQEIVRGAYRRNPAEYGYNVRFGYPSRGGLGAVVEALLTRLPRVHLGKRLVRIHAASRRLEFADGDQVDYDHLMSSIPLPELRKLLGPLPAEVSRAFDALRWISICVVHLGVRGPAALPYHWVYTPDSDLSFYRVGIPSLYAPDASPEGHHILSMEIAHSSWKPLERKTLIPRVIGDLMRMGLLESSSQIAVELLIDLSYGYPVYDRHYSWARSCLMRYLEKQGIIPLGRFGSWRYLSMEDTFLDGRQAAESISELTHASVSH